MTPPIRHVAGPSRPSKGPVASSRTGGRSGIVVAAVDQELLTGDESRSGAGEKHDHHGDVIGIAHTAERTVRCSGHDAAHDFGWEERALRDLMSAFGENAAGPGAID